MPKRVLIVEDHALLALSLRWRCRPVAGSSRRRTAPRRPTSSNTPTGSGRAASCSTSASATRRLRVDLIAPLRATGADIVMLTAETDPAVLASCLEAGAARLDRQARLAGRGGGRARRRARRPTADRLRRARAMLERCGPTGPPGAAPSRRSSSSPSASARCSPC